MCENTPTQCRDPFFVFSKIVLLANNMCVLIRFDVVELLYACSDRSIFHYIWHEVLRAKCPSGHVIISGLSETVEFDITVTSQIHVYTYRHRYRHTHTYVSTHALTYVRTCMHACMHACIHIYRPT